MTDDDDLRINTLHRFAKHSPNLVLHRYQFGEVPVGCGGVVLRWVAPEQGRPGLVRLFVPKGRGDVWMDGLPVPNSLVDLQPGRRCFALHLVRTSPGVHPFTFVVHDHSANPVDLVQRGAPRWRATAVEPAAGWPAPAFDDREWSAPPVLWARDLKRSDPSIQHRIATLAALGVVAYALDVAALWLRVDVTLDAVTP